MQWVREGIVVYMELATLSVNVRTVVADDGLWRRSLIDSEFDLDLQGRSRLQWGVRVFRKWVFRSRLFLWKVIGCVNRAQRVRSFNFKIWKFYSPGFQEHFQRVLEIFRRTGGFQEAEKEVVGCVELPEGGWFFKYIFGKVVATGFQNVHEFSGCP